MTEPAIGPHTPPLMGSSGIRFQGFVDGTCPTRSNPRVARHFADATEARP